MELLCFSMSFGTFCETLDLKRLSFSTMVSKSWTSSEPSEMVSKLIELLSWACIDLLIRLVAMNVTLGPFEARRFENCNIGFR